jgi:hypothetical protein
MRSRIVGGCYHVAALAYYLIVVHYHAAKGAAVAAHDALQREFYRQVQELLIMLI